MRVAVCGRFSLGGVKMRGLAVAERLGWDALDVKRVGWLRPLRRYDAIVLVKHHLGKAARIRRACDRLIYDPIDAWQSTEPDADPTAWWRARLDELTPDDVLATSPSCVAAIERAIGSRGDEMPADSFGRTAPRVHLFAHHADPRVRRDARDAAGPIVYAGDPQYLSDARDRIEAACRALGRRFVVAEGDGAIGSLAGAALSLCVRMPPHDTPLNRLCKPQVKLENAAAAGLPVLASDHPCVSLLRPATCRIPDPPPGGHDVAAWTRHLAAALASPPLEDPVALVEHAERLRALVVPSQGTSVGSP